MVALAKIVCSEVNPVLRILVMRPGAIGDTLLTLPVIQALRTQIGAKHITLVGNADVLPLALASGIVDATSNYELLQWSELFSATGIHNAATITLLQQTDLVICWLRDIENIVRRNLQEVGVRRVLIAPGRPLEDEHIHEIQYLAETIGLTFAIQDMMRWQLPSLEQDDLLEMANRQVIAIHPGSGGARKCWSITSFFAAIKRLWQHGLSVLLLAGAADTERLSYLQQHLPSPPEPEMFKTLVNASLLEVAQHLRQCRCYLGNDSGITHLAGMLGLPTLALFGPSDPAVWRPLGPKVEILYAPELAQLSVDLVMQRLLPHLS